MPISPASATQLFAIGGSRSKESNPTTDDEAVTSGTQKAFRPGTVVFRHPSTQGGCKRSRMGQFHHCRLSFGVLLPSCAGSKGEKCQFATRAPQQSVANRARGGSRALFDPSCRNISPLVVFLNN